MNEEYIPTRQSSMSSQHPPKEKRTRHKYDYEPAHRPPPAQAPTYMPGGFPSSSRAMRDEPEPIDVREPDREHKTESKSKHSAPSIFRPVRKLMRAAGDVLGRSKRHWWNMH